MFVNGKIHDVVVRDLTKFLDERGWLTELFREDEVPPEFLPVMCYVSMTLPGIARGPHEHADQADYFAFLGPSNFKVYLWDNRKESPDRMDALVHACLHLMGTEGRKARISDPTKHTLPRFDMSSGYSLVDNPYQT